jgi:hypothetical protein
MSDIDNKRLNIVTFAKKHSSLKRLNWCNSLHAEVLNSISAGDDYNTSG